MRTRNGRWTAACSAAASVITIVAAMALPVGAQTPSVDDLLRLVVAPKPSDLYTMHAQFDVLLSLRYGSGGLLTATAQGALTEWHRPGEPLHRTLAIREMHLPVVLRPFSGVIQRTIKERIETQPDDMPDFHAHDFFLMDEAKGRYTLGGVRRDIVTQAMVTYKSSGSARTGDPDVRRSVAKWLFTSPLMKAWVVRPGAPYALEGLVDAQGLLRAFTLFYNWGALHTQIDYAMINGAPVWDRLQSDVATSLPKLGTVTGEVTIALSNQCLDCSMSGVPPADVSRGLHVGGQTEGAR
ncbi:MAG TPA: hypothetical protein VKW09_12740 [bacterium]|nr:hypothetical protein [bacterium]